jgi:phospholipase C
MGPFAPARIEKAGPYEHTSVLKRIEWRWGLDPMTARDKNARNLALGLDFTKHVEPVKLPKVDVPPVDACKLKVASHG